MPEQELAEYGTPEERAAREQEAAMQRAEALAHGNEAGGSWNSRTGGGQ